MKRVVRIVCAAIVVACVGAVAAVCWHAVQEIHYLKTFYPVQFTVGDAFWASGVELVKVALITLPLLLVAALAVLVDWSRRRKGDES